MADDKPKTKPAAKAKAQDKTKASATPKGLRAKVDAKLFAAAASAALAAVESRNTVPILECVRIDFSSATGRVSLAATNLDQMAVIDVAAEVLVSGDICVAAKPLQAFLARLKDEVDIWLDNDRLHVSAGGASAQFPTLPARDWQGIPAPEGEMYEMELALGAFISALASVQHAAGTEETRYYLCGVYFEIKGSRLITVGTDGHRMAKRVIAMAGFQDNDGIIIPRKAVTDMLRVCARASENVHVTYSDRVIALQAGNERYVSKLVDGQYPDYDRVIPPGDTPILLCGPVKPLMKAAEIALVACREKSRALRCEVQGDHVTLVAGDAGYEQTRVRAELGEGAEMVVGYNGKLLIDALGQISHDDVTLKAETPGGPCRIESNDTGLVQVIMPLRV